MYNESISDCTEIIILQNTHLNFQLQIMWQWRHIKITEAIKHSLVTLEYHKVNLANKQTKLLWQDIKTVYNWNFRHYHHSYFITNIQCLEGTFAVSEHLKAVAERMLRIQEQWRAQDTPQQGIMAGSEHPQ